MANKTKGTIYKRGKIYWLRVIVNGVVSAYSLKTTDRKEAERLRADAMAPLAVQGKAAKVKALAVQAAGLDNQVADLQESRRKRLAVADAWQAFEDDPSRPQSGPVTLRDVKQRWSWFDGWAAGMYPELPYLESFTAAHVKEFVKTLNELSPNRYNKIIQTGRLVFRILAPQLKSTENPFALITCKPMNTRSHRELSVAELQTVCGTATGELRTMFAIGLYTALRFGDVATLRWEEVSFPLNRITRKPMKTASRSGKILAIPLHPVLRDILEETPEKERKGFVVPESAALYKRDKSALSQQIQEHYQSCGITTQVKHEEKKRKTCEVGFHSLRHSFVTICATAGVPLPVVQALCGHGSPAIQAKYVHMGVEAAGQAIDALPNIGNAVLPAAAEDAEVVRGRAVIVKLIQSCPAERLPQVLKAVQRIVGDKEK